MDVNEVWTSIRQLWENKPGTIVLVMLGIAVFVYLVIDARRHKRRRKRPR